MKNLLPFLPLSFLLFFSACEEQPYDDDQYGTNCLVVKIEIQNMMERTIVYDQYNRIIEITTDGNSMVSERMTLTYNNNIAFADFYRGGQLLCSVEAPLNAAGNVTEATAIDTAGNEIAYETFTYNADNNIITIAGRNAILDVEDTLTVVWSGSNATGFQRAIGADISCNYYTGKEHSFNMGVGNAWLLYLQMDADIAQNYSKDLLKTYDESGVVTGQPINFTYDFDSDGKVRKIMYSSAGNGNMQGTTEVSYECD
jgi:hypothetical protein